MEHITINTIVFKNVFLVSFVLRELKIVWPVSFSIFEMIKILYSLTPLDDFKNRQIEILVDSHAVTYVSSKDYFKMP